MKRQAGEVGPGLNQRKGSQYTLTLHILRYGPDIVIFNEWESKSTFRFSGKKIRYILTSIIVLLFNFYKINKQINSVKYEKTVSVVNCFLTFNNNLNIAAPIQ